MKRAGEKKKASYEKETKILRRERYVCKRKKNTNSDTKGKMKRKTLVLHRWVHNRQQ